MIHLALATLLVVACSSDKSGEIELITINNSTGGDGAATAGNSSGSDGGQNETCLDIECCEEKHGESDECSLVEFVEGVCARTDRADGTQCSDNNLCTDNDTCSDGMCQGTAKDCDDGLDCTKGDNCAPESGKCIFSANTCECRTASDCPKLSPCQGVTTCNTGQCELQDNSAVDCSALDAVDCQNSSCNEESGECEIFPNEDGSPCDDGDECTVDEQCSSGSCVTSTAIDCDDDNPCTNDTCSAAVGCINAKTNGNHCDDGNECTGDESCVEGECLGSTEVSCDDKNPCTIDSCSEADGCVYTADDQAECNDGDSCTVGDSCKSGVCAGSENLCLCDNSGDCEDDGNLCNGKPHCKEGLCKIDPSTIVSCQDLAEQSCTVLECVPKTGLCKSIFLPDGQLCNDGNECTKADHCSNGSCEGSDLSQSCDDANSCTSDSCDPNIGCVSEPILLPAACDDLNACTEGESCSAGQCTGGTLLDCDDNNICTVDSCSTKSGCKVVPQSGICNDGDLCTLNDYCFKMKCIGTPVICNNKSCFDGVCNDTSGLCDFLPKNCDDGNECTHDSCNSDSGQCQFIANNCNDDDVCTKDECNNKSCQHQTTDCNDGKACTLDLCDPISGCSNSPIDCDDGLNCTADQCVQGQCENLIVLGACDDGNACTADSCSPKSGCLHSAINPGGPCDDGNAATVADFCLAGSCSGFIIGVDESTNPAMAENTSLNHVHYTNDKFHVSGRSQVLTASSMIASLEGNKISLITALSTNNEFVALTDKMAITEGGDLLYYNGTQWHPESPLKSAFDQLGWQSNYVSAAWGTTVNGVEHFFIAGHPNGNTYIAHCKGPQFSCSKQSTDYNGFKDFQIPRAISGWVEPDNTLAAVMASDDKWNGKYYNDSFHFPGNKSDWAKDLDNSAGSSRTHDVFGLSDLNMWRVGSHGLLHGRQLSDNGNPGWASLNNVTDDQDELTLTGVWANNEVIAAVGNRELNDDQVQLVLLLHPLAKDMNMADYWHEYDLSLYKDTTQCPDADCPAFPAAIRDIWGHDNTLVVVGSYFKNNSNGSNDSLKQYPLVIRRDP